MLLALLGLLSFIAYTTHYNSSKHLDSERFGEAAKQRSTAHKKQDLLSPFIQRWQQAQTEIENHVTDDGVKKTRYFFEGYNVASNDAFVLPAEETAAGGGANHIQNLSSAIVSELVPTGYASGGGSSSGGGAGGGGAGGGGNRSDRNKTQYVVNEDLDQTDSDDTSDKDPAKTNVSTVPVPAAFWLFGSAMIGLIGLRRK